MLRKISRAENHGDRGAHDGVTGTHDPRNLYLAVSARDGRAIVAVRRLSFAVIFGKLIATRPVGVVGVHPHLDTRFNPGRRALVGRRRVLS